MKAAELLAILRRRSTKLDVPHSERAGKGGHLFVRHGGKTTVIPMHRGDIKVGTYRAILRDLGLTETDLEH